MVCCEFGIRTEQDVERAEQLYQHGAAQGNATAMLLTDKLKNQNGRGCTQMDLECQEEKAVAQTPNSSFVKQLWWWTGNQCGDEVSKALALMLLVYTLLTTLNLKCEMSALPLMKQNEEHCAKKNQIEGTREMLKHIH